VCLSLERLVNLQHGTQHNTQHSKTQRSMHNKGMTPELLWQHCSLLCVKGEAVGTAVPYKSTTPQSLPGACCVSQTGPAVCAVPPLCSTLLSLSPVLPPR
jgi:hypothetical protein